MVLYDVRILGRSISRAWMSPASAEDAQWGTADPAWTQTP